MLTWQKPPPPGPLAGDAVCVFRADLARLARRADALYPLLSKAERQRAARFARQEHGARFVAARATLRQLLGRCLDAGADELEFAYGAHGKPALAGALAGAGLHFNTSHARDLALYALAMGRRVGVDVEYPRPRLDYERIARRFFRREEYQALMALPRRAQRRAFYCLWTRKEAYLKARGTGLAAGLGAFAVSLQGGARLLRSDLGRGEVERWRLLDLELADEYVGALCAEGGNWQLRAFEWSGSDE